MANVAQWRMIRFKIAALVIRTEGQTAQPLIQRRFSPQDAKRNSQYQIVDSVASMIQGVLPAQQELEYRKILSMYCAYCGATARETN